MRIIFCEPQITMKKTENANIFIESCREILDVYTTNRLYISSLYQINHLLSEKADPNDILIFLMQKLVSITIKYLG